ncbi:hypothetical protein [Caulobacter sp. LARHSG274]
MPDEPQLTEEALRAGLALALAETAVRNSQLEELHAGVFPGSAAGDYGDVAVVTPFGQIAWADVSRISQEEMKGLMMQIVDRLYTMLLHPEPFLRLQAAAGWKAPALDPQLMDQVQRHAARAQGVDEAKIWETWPIDRSKDRPPLRLEHRASAFAASPPQAPPPLAPDVTPDGLRALAQEPLADPTWIAKARLALAAAADEWQRAQWEVLDAGTCIPDDD